MADDPRPARGMLLVARPTLLDPNFTRTVVLLCDHDDAEGSLGFVLNRPSPSRLGEVLQGDHDFEGRNDPVFVGGPVELDKLAILHHEKGLPGALEVLPGIFLGGQVEALGERVRKRDTPEGGIRFFVGYSGWGKGQLSREMEEDTWIVCPARPEWVFDPEPATLWKRMIRAVGGEWHPSAREPADPEMN